MKCPHCDVMFQSYDCTTNPGKDPANGDAGVCAKCGGWWMMHQGQYFKYAPTREDLLRIAVYARLHQKKAGYN